MSLIELAKNETLENRKRIAENDIQCFKVIEERLSSSGRYEYKTLPLYSEIPEDTIEGKTEFHPKGERNIRKLNETTFELGSGFINSFAKITDATHYMEAFYTGYLETRPTIYSCIIPKGTEYYETTNIGMQSYASLCVKFDKPMTERVYGITKDYKRMEKNYSKKKKYGIVFKDADFSGDNEPLEDDI